MRNNVVNYNKQNYFDLFDPFFNDFFGLDRNTKYNEVMKTDIIDHDDSYEMKIDLPEVNKEDVKMSLEDGYLTIEAKVEKNTENNDKYIRKERYYGEYKRSYYIGDNINEEDIDAKLENGVLNLTIKKKELKAPEKKYIEIK
jgi:HSP20 family molecular chaperone IbpA